MTCYEVARVMLDLGYEDLFTPQDLIHLAGVCHTMRACLERQSVWQRVRLAMDPYQVIPATALEEWEAYVPAHQVVLTILYRIQCTYPHYLKCRKTACQCFISNSGYEQAQQWVIQQSVPPGDLVFMTHRYCRVHWVVNQNGRLESLRTGDELCAYLYPLYPIHYFMLTPMALRWFKRDQFRILSVMKMVECPMSGMQEWEAECLLVGQWILVHLRWFNTAIGPDDEPVPERLQPERILYESDQYMLELSHKTHVPPCGGNMGYLDAFICEFV
jgi:hypothetical protein